MASHEHNGNLHAGLVNIDTGFSDVRGVHWHDNRANSRRSLLISLILILTYAVAEVVGGIISGSLALLADAGHMATDAGAIGLALLAVWLAGRPASIQRTFGFQRFWKFT